jgi:hypothetical protein
MPTTINRKTPQEPKSGKRPGSMIRVPDATHSILRELADETGEPMQNLLAEAVEAMRRRRILELTNAAYAAMRADPVAWQAELAERQAWDVTLPDGLEEE